MSYTTKAAQAHMLTSAALAAFRDAQAKGEEADFSFPIEAYTLTYDKADPRFTLLDAEGEPAVEKGVYGQSAEDALTDFLLTELLRQAVASGRRG